LIPGRAFSLVMLLIACDAAGWSSAAIGCPVCDTGTGEQVRAALESDLKWGVLATASPFALVLAVVGMIQFDAPLRRRRVRSTPRE
jgi:hypothetical protein